MQSILSNEMFIIIVRLSLIVLLSGFIGFERELKNHPAGLRTHILVGVGSCLLMLLSLFGFEDFINSHPQATRYDPSRIPSYVVSGIGFLGAGTILVHGGVTVKGLTTAASIWTVAGLGLVVGVGMYFEAVLVTVIIITTLLFLDKLETKLEALFKKRDIPQESYLISIVINEEKENLNQINQLFLDKKLEIQKFNMEYSDWDESVVKYTFKVKVPNTINQIEIMESLQHINNVQKVQIES
ncbi:MgtC/SapB family protein [Neobacillus kokaensis]|uniref:Magnesium transporter MgtC n=1 Tax=Neobacillus kokaensis TaxID=2759023 RepID=A0ABQ3NCB4_9BACI|nr:MgtC/SapB family protein [Neobacillus kokaensis]GHI01538.1 magnesium transporter MgtC [Neobacillus kokaensis]